MKYFSVYKESRGAVVTLFMMNELGDEDKSYNFRSLEFRNNNQAAMYNTLVRNMCAKVFTPGIQFTGYFEEFDPLTWRLE
jgi:hypothetical protein